jgi:hypothetical protein
MAMTAKVRMQTFPKGAFRETKVPFAP